MGGQLDQIEENINGNLENSKNTVNNPVGKNKDTVSSVSSARQSSSSTSSSDDINGNEKTVRNAVKDTVGSVSEDTKLWQVVVMNSLVQYLPVEWGQVTHSDLSKSNLTRTTPARFYAQMWWAFTKSDHWPTTLKSLDDVLRSYTTIANQYDKFYARVPEHKQPHNLGAGQPKEQAEDDDPFTVPEDQTAEEDKLVIPFDEEL